MKGGHGCRSMGASMEEDGSEMVFDIIVNFLRFGGVIL